MRKHIVILLIITIILVGVGSFAAEESNEEFISLHIGSPLILAGEEILSLDSENPGVVPIIYKERTLVPLRAISEHFGATVSYDASQRTALIVYDGIEYKFPIDMGYYEVKREGQIVSKKEFDTKTLIIQGRTMVPLRVIAEKILHKEVAYESRVIFIGKSQKSIDNKLVEETKAKIGQALKVNSRAELLAIINAMEETFKEELTRESVFDSLAPTTNESGAAQQDGAKDFASTNEQVEGINESDVVKTDGEFIYVATRDSIKIYRANNGYPQLTDEIKVSVNKDTGEYIEYSELYIDNGKLIILGRKGEMRNWIRPLPQPEPGIMVESIMPYDGGREFVYLGIYDVNRDGKLSLIKEVEVQGNLLSSRKKDNHVYLVVNKHLSYYGPYAEEFIPMFRDSTIGADYKELPVDSVLYHPTRYSPNYLLITAVDIEDEKKPATIEAFLGSGSEVYMSENGLYVAGNDYSSFWGSVTNIARFTVEDTKIGYSGGGMVEGRLLNQFSMDEHNGNLRLATTKWSGESLNAVYILDKNLNQIGAVENLAPGERIYSARFMGDMGYIVTFRQVDPLFVLDLADPFNPKVTGELKVPGFSNYLHPISKDVLLGIGQDVDEKTGRQQGIKLSLFDVSDSGVPKEIGNLILGDSGSSAEVLYNHKALMIKEQDDIIAFHARLSSAKGDISRKTTDGVLVINVSEEGNLELIKQISNEGIYGQNVERPIYIEDVLYYVIDDSLRAFQMNDYTEMK